MLRLAIVFFLALLFLLQYRLWFAENAIPDYFFLLRNIKYQEKDIEKLKRESQELVTEIKAVKKSDDRLIESAREKLGLIGQSETFYLVIPKDNE